LLAQDGPLAERLRSANVSVEVLSLDERTRSLGRERAFVELPLQLVATLRYAFRIARRVRELDADVVHTNSLKADIYGGFAARFARVPAVWQVHDRIARDYLPRPVVALVRAAARVLPSAIVANSRETLGTLPARRTSAIVHAPVDALDVRTNGWQGPLRVGMIGRLAPWKGQHVFLDAFAQAFGDGDATARVIGAALFGEDEEEYGRALHGQIDSLGLTERVELTGFRADVAAELAQLDVLVHASVVPEPFGLVVAEGMAAGLPVVAADAGGPAEMIEDGVTGLLYRAGDAAALAEALRRLEADAPLRHKLGDAAREHARAFTPERAAEQLLEVFRSVR
jgi:glycosyltransferase involved in cell wall biosynthesis